MHGRAGRGRRGERRARALRPGRRTGSSCRWQLAPEQEQLPVANERWVRIQIALVASASCERRQVGKGGRTALRPPLGRLRLVSPPPPPPFWRGAAGVRGRAPDEAGTPARAWPRARGRSGTEKKWPLFRTPAAGGPATARPTGWRLPVASCEPLVLLGTQGFGFRSGAVMARRLTVGVGLGGGGAGWATGVRRRLARARAGAGDDFWA